MANRHCIVNMPKTDLFISSPVFLNAANTTFQPSSSNLKPKIHSGLHTVADPPPVCNPSATPIFPLPATSLLTPAPALIASALTLPWLLNSPSCFLLASWSVTSCQMESFQNTVTDHPTLLLKALQQCPVFLRINPNTLPCPTRPNASRLLPLCPPQLPSSSSRSLGPTHAATLQLLGWDRPSPVWSSGLPVPLPAMLWAGFCVWLAHSQLSSKPWTKCWDSPLPLPSPSTMNAYQSTCHSLYPHTSSSSLPHENVSSMRAGRFCLLCPSIPTTVLCAWLVFSKQPLNKHNLEVGTMAISH